MNPKISPAMRETPGRLAELALMYVGEAVGRPLLVLFQGKVEVIENSTHNWVQSWTRETRW